MEAQKLKIFSGLLNELKRDLETSSKELVAIHLPAVAVFVIFSMLDGLIFSGTLFGAIVSPAISFLVFRLVGFFSTGTTAYFLAARQTGVETNFDSILSRLKTRFEPTATAGLKTSVYTLLGLMAFLIPGFYLSAIYLFAPTLLLTDDKMDAQTAIEESKRIVLPYFWELLAIELGTMFVFIFVISWVAVVAALILPFGATPIFSTLALVPVGLAYMVIHNVILARVFFRLSPAPTYSTHPTEHLTVGQQPISGVTRNK